MTNVAPFKAIPIDSSGSPKWGSWVYGHCTLGPLSRASTISGPDCTEIPICFETLCRFTGVYSGNVGIYEQDLVYRNGTFGVVECYLVPNPNGDFNHVYKIRWYGCNSNLYTDDLSYWSDMVTVVGNVYEPRWCEFMNIYCTYDRNSTPQSNTKSGIRFCARTERALPNMDTMGNARVSRMDKESPSPYSSFKMEGTHPESPSFTRLVNTP